MQKSRTFHIFTTILAISLCSKKNLNEELHFSKKLQTQLGKLEKKKNSNSSNFQTEARLASLCIAENKKNSKRQSNEPTRSKITEKPRKKHKK